MFEPEKVEIPEKVKFYKKSKWLYVYMVGEKKYIKDKKYVVEKRSLIGLKIDDKYMHQNQNYYKLFNVKREVRVEQEPREFSDTLSVGATIALQTIAEKSE